MVKIASFSPVISFGNLPVGPELYPVMAISWIVVSRFYLVRCNSRISIYVYRNTVMEIRYII